MALTPEPGQRADAARRRASLLDAAGRVYLRDGPRVTLDTIAREAGVGIATLYRNFADRDQLLTALAVRAYEVVDRLAAHAAAGDLPPVDALHRLFASLLNERDQLAALPLLGGPPAPGERTQDLARRIDRSLTAVLRRGVDAGTVRPDLTASDLIVAGAMLAHPQLPPENWTVAAGRIAALLVDGIRPRTDPTGLPPPPITRPELDTAIRSR